MPNLARVAPAEAALPLIATWSPSDYAAHLEQLDPAACQDLWLSVLTLALRDLEDPDPYVADDARCFFSASQAVADICALLGVEVAWLRRQLAPWLAPRVGPPQASPVPGDLWASWEEEPWLPL